MQIIVSGAGAQPVDVYASDALGRPVKPSSATVRIVDLSVPETDASREVLASGPATIDAVSTTLTAAAGPREADARVLTVADSTGFTVWRRYAVQADGATEAFVVERVDGLDVWARDELRTRFELGAAVIGIRVSVDFPAATADDADELGREAVFGVDWTLTGITGPTQLRTLARIERRQHAARATVLDLAALDPRVVVASHERTTLEAHVAQADAEVTAELQFVTHTVERHHGGELGRLAVTYRALELAYRTLGGEAYADRAVWAGGEYKRWLSKLVSGHKPVDAIETTRTSDRVTPRRRAGLPKLIVGVGS